MPTSHRMMRTSFGSTTFPARAWGTVLSVDANTAARRAAATVQLQPSRLQVRVQLAGFTVQEGQTLLAQRRHKAASGDTLYTVVAVRPLDAAKSPSTEPHELREIAQKADVDPEDLTRDIMMALHRVPQQPSVDDELTADEEKILRASGQALAPLPPPAKQASTWTGLTLQTLIRHSRSVDEVAARAGTTTAWIQQEIAQRHLLTVHADDEMLLPEFQFANDGSPIPGLGGVIERLDPGLHPVAVMTFLTRPQADLDKNGDPLSPIEWLLAGGPPFVVEDLAADLDLGW